MNAQSRYSLTQNEHILKRTFTSSLSLWGVVLLLCTLSQLNAQDIHFSQFYNAPLSLNPAMTAVHSADVSFAANYRNQWNEAISNPYSTLFFAADKKFYFKGKYNQFVGGGLTFYWDEAGDASLSIAQIGLNGSYTYALDKENFLSFGLSLGFNQRSFKPGELTFGSQYNDGQFDPSRPTNEDFSNTSIFFANAALGANYHGQKVENRSQMDAGVALFHFNRPNQSFLEGDDSPLPMRVSFYFFPTIQIAQRFDLHFAGSAQFQSSYFEALAGGGLRIHISQKRTKEFALQLGGGYRFNSFGDAIIPTVQFIGNNWLLGLSYDVNVSDFKAATNRQGGPEIALRYTITNVPVPEELRICKLF